MLIIYGAVRLASYLVLDTLFVVFNDALPTFIKHSVYYMLWAVLIVELISFFHNTFLPFYCVISYF